MFNVTVISANVLTRLLVVRIWHKWSPV